MIVIDPGHGGIDPGANGANGIVEKELVLTFAQQLKKKLEVIRPLPGCPDTRPGRVHLARRPRPCGAGGQGRSLHLDPCRFDLRRAGCPGADGLYRLGTGLGRRIRPASPIARTRPMRRPASKRATGPTTCRHPQELTLRETRSFSHRFAGRLVGELDSVAQPEQKSPPAGALPGAAGARRAVRAARAWLSLEPEGPRPVSSPMSGAARTIASMGVADRPVLRDAVGATGSRRSFTIDTVWISVAGARFLG